MLTPANPFRQPWRLVERDESFTITDASNTAVGMSISRTSRVGEPL